MRKPPFPPCMLCGKPGKVQGGHVHWAENRVTLATFCDECDGRQPLAPVHKCTHGKSGCYGVGPLKPAFENHPMTG